MNNEGIAKEKVREDVETNKHFAEHNEPFKQACEKAGLKSTTRQASKWRMQKGKAWKEK